MKGQGWRQRLGLLMVTASVLAGVGLAAPAGATGARPGAARALDAGLPVSGVIKVCRCASDIVADPVTGSLWVAYSEYHKILVFSERSLRLVRSIQLPPTAYPLDMAADPRTGVVWVAELGLVSEISGRHLSVLRNIQIGNFSQGPQQIAVDPKAGKVWVSIDAGWRRGGVQQIDEATGKVGPMVPMPNVEWVAADPKAGTVWATDRTVPVQEIREATASVIAKVHLPGIAFAIAADPVSGKVWVVTDIFPPRVFEIDSATHRLIAQIPIRHLANRIAADPSTGTAWVGLGASYLSLISEGRQIVARTLRLAGGTNAVAVDSRSHMVFTLNSGGTINFFRYSAPRYTTAPHASFRAGAFGRFVVRTQGFPLAEMSLRGHLPPGLHATRRLGTLVVKGTPTRSDRPGNYRVEVMADNGIGTPQEDYTFVQHLVIRLR